MKKQLNPTIKAHLLRAAFYLILLLAVCVIPFALGQRNATKRSAAKRMPQQVAQRSTDTLQLPYDVLTPNLSPWTIVAPYPLIIESPSVCSDGAFAYAAGGRDAANFLPTNAFNRYDLRSRSVRMLASQNPRPEQIVY